jgi:hypothetical protein
VLSTSALALGSHPITASYAGNATHAPSSAGLTQIVNPVITGGAAIPVLDYRGAAVLALLLAGAGLWISRRR